MCLPGISLTGSLTRAGEGCCLLPAFAKCCGLLKNRPPRNLLAEQIATLEKVGGEPPKNNHRDRYPEQPCDSIPHRANLPLLQRAKPDALSDSYEADIVPFPAVAAWVREELYCA